MSPFALALIEVGVSLAVLVWSADRFVAGSAAIARHFKISPLVIGMVIIGFGTSAPEMMVSAISSLRHQPGIALGNAYGSNIVNIALILGLAALLKPMRVHSQVLTEELPLLAGVSLLSVGLVDGGMLSKIDAVILLLVFAVLMIRTVRQTRVQTFDILAQEPFGVSAAAKPLISRRHAIVWSVIGLAALVISSRFFVNGSVALARAFGVSELVIGLTVVAVGTSLPELFSSIVAVFRGEDDLAIGNVIGSNLFNTLAVVGVAGLVWPDQSGMPVEPVIILRDLPVMNVVTLLLFAFCYRFSKGRMGRLNRFHGAVLLGLYGVYTAYLCWKG